MKENIKGKPGTLFLVATPIGTLEDISFRAIRILKSVSMIAAEDTRQTRKLLTHFKIHTPVVSYREQNRISCGQKLLDFLIKGEDVALCSDAGMPLISDPGGDLVRLCIKNGINVTVIPGANAALAALSVSGFSTGSFLFLGFLPRKKNKKLKLLESIAGEPHTLIFYESPLRVLELLKCLAEILGNRQAVVVREITKFHEEVLRGALKELIGQMETREYKGEFTVVVEGAAPQEETTGFNADEVVEKLEQLMGEGMEKKQAIKKLANDLKISRQVLYRAIIEKEHQE